MPNGVVLIDRWTLRLVGVDADTVFSAEAGRLVPRVWYFNAEAGGELAHATWPDGQAWHASLGRVRLHAVTRTGVPVEGVVVCLRDTHYRGHTGFTGDVEIVDLVPGPYTILLGAQCDIAAGVGFVAARDSTVRLELRVPFSPPRR